MTINDRELRKCCKQDPLLHVDTERSSYSLRCVKCGKKAVGLTLVGTVEQWNNNEVIRDIVL